MPARITGQLPGTSRGRFHISGFGVYQALSSLIAGCAARNYNAGAMRIFAGCLLVAVGSVLLTQSSQEFHSRYGEPDIERFAARPGISLAVEYGSDHLACQVVIEPPQSLIHQEEQARLMSSDGASQVLEEVAPVAMRGKETNAMIHVSGCNEARMTDYEKVFIMRTTHTCDASSLDQDVRIAITFKRDICPKPKTPFTVNRPQRPIVGRFHLMSALIRNSGDNVLGVRAQDGSQDD